MQRQCVDTVNPTRAVEALGVLVCNHLVSFRTAFSRLQSVALAGNRLCFWSPVGANALCLYSDLSYLDLSLATINESKWIHCSTMYSPRFEYSTSNCEFEATAQMGVFSNGGTSMALSQLDWRVVCAVVCMCLRHRLECEVHHCQWPLCCSILFRSCLIHPKSATVS